MARSYNKLRGRIVEKFGSQGAFAEKLGISRQWVSMKLNNKSEFSQSEILKWCDVLEISEREIVDYFFAQ